MARRPTNTFGEAWQGSSIKGAGALARARGYAYGRLTSKQREGYGSQKNFQRAAEASPAVSGQTGAESDEARETRLKQQGREEVMKRAPQFVKPVTGGGESLASRLRNQTGSVTTSTGGGDMADGLNRASERWSKPQMPSTKPRVNWNTPTPSADALRSLRRKINRREQKPSYTPDGQVIRGGW